MPYDLVGVIDNEARAPPGLHPQILLLVTAFLRYLKEPRYQLPLTLPELLRLFQLFSKDLNLVVIHLYTQLNTNKRQLLASLAHFAAHPHQFDYLLAIAAYSTSSLKLMKRTDAAAVAQLRVFNYYKLVTIFGALELAQNHLFNSVSSEDGPELVRLYDKVLRFDHRDVVIQRFLDQKLRLLRALDLPFSTFSEHNDNANDAKLDRFFADLKSSPNKALAEVQTAFLALNDSRTPFSKLRCIVSIQKHVIALLTELYPDNHAKINNDVLLPSVIYIIIYLLPESMVYDLYLNFTFVKNFLNLIDPYKVDLTYASTATSFASYTPAEKHLSNKVLASHTKKKPSSNLYELLNIDESNTTDDVFEEPPAEPIDFFHNDKALLDYIQTNHFNNGELNYYLTNFEAILFFILNVTIDELTSSNDTIADEYANNDILKTSLHRLVDKELVKDFQFPQHLDKDEIEKQMNEELNDARTRSGSLLNTISNKINDAAISVNRSRSNSSIMNTLKSSNSSRDTFAGVADFESSIVAAPVVDNAGDGSISLVRNILGRFGPVLLIRGSIDENLETTETGKPVLIVESNPEGLDNIKHKRSNSIINRLSPNHSRTRSSSLENQFASLSTRNNPNDSKRNSLTSKFTTGVSEFMTKLNNPASVAAIGTTIADAGHGSSSSLHSLIVPSEEGTKRPDLSRSRTTSLQIMDKWFNNISSHPNTANNAPATASVAAPPSLPTVEGTPGILTMDMTSNDGSVFSTSFRELTKYQHLDFEQLTVHDLRNLKSYYDQLCSELNVTKTESKTSHEQDDDDKLTNDESSL